MVIIFFLLHRAYLLIPEVVKSHLPEFLDWAVQIVASDDSDLTKVNLKLGALSALSAVYKHGKREDLRKAATTVLKVAITKFFDVLSVSFFATLIFRKQTC